MKRHKVILFVIVALGFLVRFVGSWYGFPYVLGHFDEIFSVRQAMSFGATHSLRPIMLMYPTFHSYILFVIYLIYFALGKIAGWFASPADFAFMYLIKPFSLYFLARMVSVISGTATILTTYLIAKQLYNPRVGLWAAWLLAMSTTHVIYSHWAKPDIFMVFLASVSLMFATFILTDQRMKNYSLAGLFAGLAVAAKYNAAFVFLPFAVIHWFVCDKKGLLRHIFNQKLLGYFFMMVIGFFITSPYCFIAAPFCYREVMYDLNMLHFGEPGNISTLPWLWIIINIFSNNAVYGVIFSLGIIYCLLKPKRNHWILLAYVLPFSWFIGRSAKVSLHYLLPMYPALYILGAVFVDRIFFLLRKRKFLSISLFLLMLAITSIKTYELKLDFLGRDSRAVAKEWIDDNVPAGAKLALFTIRYRDLPLILSQGGEVDTIDYGPRARNTYRDEHLNALLDDYFRRHKTFRVYKLEKEIPGTEVDSILAGLGFPNNSFLRSYYQQGWKSLEEMQAQGIEYVFLPSFLYGLYEKLPDKHHPLYRLCKQNQEYFSGLMASKEMQLVKEIPASGLGPTIRIYKVSY
ncbi:MAG: ArnT family glycosyltransferase [Candidatus Omnitrophota bacterium]